MKNFWNLIIAFILIFIVISFASVLSLGNSIKDKLVWAVDSYTLKNKDIITFGQNADICYGNFKQGGVTLKYHQEDGKVYCDWNIDSIGLDTLLYMKLNGSNPNIITIEKESNICIGKVRLRGSDIYKAWNDWEQQQYVMLKNVIASQSEEFRCYKDSTFIRSCFAREKGKISSKRNGKIKLILLDKYTTVDGRGYTYSGSFPTIEENAMHCVKIQFFTILESFLQEATPAKGMINIEGVNYMAKPMVVLNKWGASHVMLRHQKENETVVCFPKPNMFVGDYQSLADNSSKTSHIISLRQEEKTFPTAYDLYVSQMTSSFSENICPIHFMQEANSYSIRLNSNDSICFESRFLPDNFIDYLFPHFDKFNIPKTNVTLHARSGFLNTGYFFRFLYGPLLYLILLILLILAPKTGYINVPRSKTLLKNQYSAYRIYLVAFLLIFFIYYICKVLIAIKLSYTSPYFERLSLITPSCFIASLGLFSLLYIHFNLDCMEGLSIKKKMGKTTPICLFCIFGFLYQYCALQVGDNSSILNSYFQAEISEMNFLKWSDNPSIMDTNRNVLYGLYLGEVIAAMLLIVRIFVFPILTNKYKMCVTILQNTKKTLLLQPTLNKSNKMFESVLKSSFFKKYDLTGNRLKKCVLYIVLILIVGNLSNFATALITLLVIFGLESTLTFPREAFQNNWKDRIILYGIIIAITVMFFIVAFLPDKGYLTNFIGFIGAAILFVFLQEKDRIIFENRNKKKAILKYSPFLGLILLLLIIKVILPIYAKEDTAKYSRTTRRISMYADFENQRNKGYRYSESDAEFMAIMAHYTGKKDTIKADPLSNDIYPLHSSFSSGQAPVILNDMSVPAAFLGCYGWKAKIAYFLLPIALMLLVFTLNLKYFSQSIHALFTSQARRAMLASFMWVGTTAYLYLSYRGAMPFTGRLNPGLGVDSLGEAMESTILLAFMASIKITKK